jgi:hypothetical protein
MSRSSGTYTAPVSSWNPAVEATTIDETDWNALLADMSDALTESVYTSSLGATDNRLVRTDGTDTKKVQGSAITCDDDANLTGVLTVTLTPVVVASLPSPGEAGMVAFASDGRKNGEGAGLGTGVLVFHDGSSWVACDTGATVAA